MCNLMEQSAELSCIIKAKINIKIIKLETIYLLFHDCRIRNKYVMIRIQEKVPDSNSHNWFCYFIKYRKVFATVNIVSHNFFFWEIEPRFLPPFLCETNSAGPIDQVQGRKETFRFPPPNHNRRNWWLSLVTLLLEDIGMELVTQVSITWLC